MNTRTMALDILNKLQLMPNHPDGKIRYDGRYYPFYEVVNSISYTIQRETLREMQLLRYELELTRESLRQEKRANRGMSEKDKTSADPVRILDL